MGILNMSMWFKYVIIFRETLFHKRLKVAKSEQNYVSIKRILKN